MMSSEYQQVEKELLFYFNHSQAAVGFKSSHASFVAAVYGVSCHSTETDLYTDGLMVQVRKIRQIRNTYFSLPQETRRVLEAVYNLEYQYRYPVELVSIYGHKVGAVFFNGIITNLPDLVKLCKKKKQSRLTDQEQVLMFNIGENTRKLWEKIHIQYMEARQFYLNEKSKNVYIKH